MNFMSPVKQVDEKDIHAIYKHNIDQEENIRKIYTISGLEDPIKKNKGPCSKLQGIVLIEKSELF